MLLLLLLFLVVFVVMFVAVRVVAFVMMVVTRMGKVATGGKLVRIAGSGARENDDIPVPAECHGRRINGVGSAAYETALDDVVRIVCPIRRHYTRRIIRRGSGERGNCLQLEEASLRCDVVSERSTRRDPQCQTAGGTRLDS